MTESPADISSRYSQFYENRGKPKDDDLRMRTRLGALMMEHDFIGMASLVEKKLGIRPGKWREFCQTADLADLMDTLTICFRGLAERPTEGYSSLRDQYRREAIVFRDEVALIFKEQNVGYRVTELCAVRHSVDEEFEKSKTYTLTVLSEARFANVRAALDGGLGALVAVPPNDKEAIRGVFGACEALFRLEFPKAPRLAADQVRQHLIPIIEKQHSADRAAREANRHFAQAFVEWVDGAHWYRHEQGVEEVNQPDRDLAVAYVSSGLAFIRWLVSLTATINGQG